MLKLNNNTLKYILLFFIGGFSYCGIELLFRGYSHISMLVAGGICFVLIGLLNEIFPYKVSIISQMFISSLIITLVEFISGYIVNILLGLNVWDYSDLPYNFLGQICLLFSNIWFLLSLPAILLDDYLKYYLLGEEKPTYKVF
ncbi:MAG: putative rane protein [Anaerocolumna sp.]|nr:putative rane protein [Anaerocolumna sp.]